MTAVLVVGAGPVGLAIAAELARHGQPCRIIDRLDSPSGHCKALGVTPRTLEVWDDMGIARPMIDAGLWIEGLRTIVPGEPPRDGCLHLSDLPYGNLAIPQYETERILAEHLARHGVNVERGMALAGLNDDGHRVSVEFTGRYGRSDADGAFARAYAAKPGMTWLIRPEGYIGFSSARFDCARLGDFLQRIYRR
jgi:2-polyprenyl-6-methoxyphenol hydroxylase-like FAD-dependent oxidoreductase